MKKKTLVILFILGMSAFGIAGFTLGQIYTQSQINSFSEQQIKSNLDFALDSTELTENQILFKISFNNLKKQEDRYIGFRDALRISFSKKAMIECIKDVNKSYCLYDFLKPVIIEQAKEEKKAKVKQILEYKSEADNFTQEDLESLITDQELNE
ncbi:MAG TPA: hypothetical protein ENH90_01960 [bacterium]|nr:hypothetical protein [bacterium]